MVKTLGDGHWCLGELFDVAFAKSTALFEIISAMAELVLRVDALPGVTHSTDSGLGIPIWMTKRPDRRSEAR